MTRRRRERTARPSAAEVERLYVEAAIAVCGYDPRRNRNLWVPIEHANNQSLRRKISVEFHRRLHDAGIVMEQGPAPGAWWTVTGKNPNKVRVSISVRLYGLAEVAASKEGLTIEEWIERTLSKSVESDKCSP